MARMRVLLLCTVVALMLGSCRAIFAEAQGGCNPWCRWECKDPECKEVCHPACLKPECTIECEPIKCHKCPQKCNSQPVPCKVMCPKLGCFKNDCSKCVHRCPKLKQNPCSQSCAPPKPKCQPKCKTKCWRKCLSKCKNNLNRPTCSLKCPVKINCPKPKCCKCNIAANFHAAWSQANGGQASGANKPSFLETFVQVNNDPHRCCPCAEQKSHAEAAAAKRAAAKKTKHAPSAHKLAPQVQPKKAHAKADTATGARALVKEKKLQKLVAMGIKSLEDKKARAQAALKNTPFYRSYQENVASATGAQQDSPTVDFRKKIKYPGYPTPAQHA